MMRLMWVGQALALAAYESYLAAHLQLVGAKRHQHAAVAGQAAQALQRQLEGAGGVRVVLGRAAQLRDQLVELADVALVVAAEAGDLVRVVAVLQLFHRDLVRAYGVMVELEQVVETFQDLGRGRRRVPHVEARRVGVHRSLLGVSVLPLPARLRSLRPGESAGMHTPFQRRRRGIITDFRRVTASPKAFEAGRGHDGHLARVRVRAHLDIYILCIPTSVSTTTCIYMFSTCSYMYIFSYM